MSRRHRTRLAVTAVYLVIATMTMAPVVAGAAGPASSSTSDAVGWTSTGGVNDATECRTESESRGVPDGISEPRVIPTTLEIERIEGTEKIRFTYTFDLPNDTTHFDIESLYPDDGYSVVSTKGFDDDQKLSWDETTATPTLTIEHTLSNDTNDSFQRVQIPDVGGFIQREDPPDGHVDSVYREPVGFWLNTSVQMCMEGHYVDSSQQLVVGSYTTYTERADGKQITLFVPDGANMSVSPEAVITALAATERTIQGDPHHDVYLFVVDAHSIAVGGAGILAGFASERTATVAAGAPLETYIHEFVHVNEEADYSRNMTWFTEGSAEYYGNNFEAVDGQLRIKYAKVLKRTDPDHGWSKRAHHNEVLAKPDTWDERTDYKKGSRLLFALDAKLRAATDGEVTIHELMRRINEHAEVDGQVTYGVFRQMVVDLANEETASWLDPYVLTSQAVPQPNSSAFGSIPSFTEETANTSGGARETFEFTIAIPSEEQRGPESATLSIESPRKTVQASISDGNDDGRITVEFQPYGPDGGSVLEVADSSDEITISEGTVEEPIVSGEIQVKLIVTDTSGSYTVATRSITLTSTPTETPQTESSAGPSVKLSIDSLQNFFYEYVSDLSSLDLIIGGPLSLAIVILLIKARNADQ